MKSGSVPPAPAPATPVLHAVTRPLDEVPGLERLLSYADPRDPLVWTRGDRGCAGLGEALRLDFSGPERFADAARAWRGLAAAAVVDDPVRLPGTGLVGFGAFAFADGSEGRNAIIVPRLLIARHRGTAWVTEISAEPPTRDPRPPEPAAQDPRLPEPAARGSWSGVRLPVAETDEAYLAGVRDAAARIDRGDVEKIVLARRVGGRIAAGDDLRVPLARLAERYADCWTYAVDGMLGASPETLVRWTDGAISARVLAGTRGRRPESPAADARARDELLTSAKEQHEHAFAVQSVVTALAPHVRGLHTSEEPYALELPNVWHLATDLGAIPGDGGSSLELAAALHPTAAVAGTPTAAAVDAIAELEGFDRGRYAGPVGWIDADGEGEWVIALRCAEVGAEAGSETEAAVDVADEAGGARAGYRAVTAYAGGGIVAGSDPEREFAETVSKFAPIADAFAP